MQVVVDSMVSVFMTYRLNCNETVLGLTSGGLVLVFQKLVSLSPLVCPLGKQWLNLINTGKYVHTR